MRSFVITASRSGGIGNGLTYDTAGKEVKPGMLVQATLRGKPTEALVVSVGEPLEQEKYDVKPITSVISPISAVSKAHIALLHWMSSYYACSRRQVLQVLLPPPPWKTLVPRETIAYVATDAHERKPKGSKQKEVWEYVNAKGRVSIATLKYALKATPATLKALVEQGFLRTEITAPGEEEQSPPPRIDAPALTAIQEKAYQEMTADKRPSLLFGITGSGKTEVYAKMIADAVNGGGQALLLVPEILLTQHSIDRFERLVPRERLAMLHSRLLAGARRKEWKRIRSGQVSLVIGSRSALFAPLPNLKLIIIDEEHEWTYKNEQMPRYHARETAEMLAGYCGAKLVMGTATPSLEAWSRAVSGKYHLARLPERYQNRPVPTVRVVDLATIKFGNAYPFSPVLLEAIDQRLKKQEQTVLFLNRRGMASALLCMQCRRRILSPDSALPYTLHRTPDGRPFLLDHISGAATDIPAGCPSCGSHSLQAVGAGTQKLEDLLPTLFPTARVIRADSDTLKHPEQMRTLLSKMRNREADILLGTQAVVKGLDLPGVTLAAVMVADVGLSLPHFRAGGRVFQLLTQLTGRSGRAQPGEVIIQTFRPDAPEIVAAASHKTEEYLEQELALRAAASYPPMAPMIRLIFSENDARKRAQDGHERVKKTIAAQKLSVTSGVAPTLFGGGRVWHVILRGKDARRLLPVAQELDCAIDVDPIDTL